MQISQSNYKSLRTNTWFNILKKKKIQIYFYEQNKSKTWETCGFRHKIILKDHPNVQKKQNNGVHGKKMTKESTSSYNNRIQLVSLCKMVSNTHTWLHKVSKEKCWSKDLSTVKDHQLRLNWNVKAFEIQ